MKKIKIIVMITVLTFTLATVSFAWTRPHWCRGATTTTRYMENNKDIVEKVSVCCGSTTTTILDSFDTLEYDLYLNSPSSTTSVTGKIGFEYGTKIKKGTHFDFNNLKYHNSKKYDFEDSLVKKTSLNDSSFSDVDEYTLTLAEDDYTLYSELTDTYPGDVVEDSVDFYVGPYPTVSCKVELKDDNLKDSHHDSIHIYDIKLKSTYQPHELIFEVYKGNTYLTSYKTTPNASSSYETGWKSSFYEINNNMGTNLKPGEQINIRVRVVDGRGTGTTNITNSNSPKYAKYSSSPVY